MSQTLGIGTESPRFIRPLPGNEILTRYRKVRIGHPSGGYLTVKRLKNSLRTTQPLVSNQDPLLEERDALIEFARKAKPGRSIFRVSRSQFWRILRKYAAIAGIPAHKAHPHVPKHSLAMHTIPHAGIENVRQYLGHKSGTSTMQYLRVSDEDASAAIVNALGRKRRPRRG